MEKKEITLRTIKKISALVNEIALESQGFESAPLFDEWLSGDERKIIESLPVPEFENEYEAGKLLVNNEWFVYLIGSEYGKYLLKCCEIDSELMIGLKLAYYFSNNYVRDIRKLHESGVETVVPEK